MQKITRRELLARAGMATAAFAVPAMFPGGVLGANEKIVMGTVGCGGQGSGDMHALKGTGLAEFAAVCDVYTANRERARIANGPSCEGYNDFRELLDRKDIDAINVGTPDHWHALIAIAACEAGKDIYGQKPLCLTIEEGRAMVNAVRRHNRIFQTGSQQRSDDKFRYACELVRNGRIGKIKEVRTAVGRNPSCPYDPDTDPPDGLDWNMYLGPAKWAPFNKHRFIWDFRWFYDYSGGNLTDWGAHHNDIAQWGLGMDTTGPVHIDGKGAFPASGLFDTPNTYEVTYTYSSGIKLICSSEGNSCVFYGSDGEISVNRGFLASKPNEIIQEPIKESETHLYKSQNHYQNFLECVKSRKLPICDVETGFRSVSVCHLGNISVRLGRPIRWDPATEKIQGDEEANRWLSRPMRAPWHL